MADLGTAVGKVILALERAGASGTAAGDGIRMALRNAIMSQRYIHYRWNTAAFSLTPLVVSQLAYTPGSDGMPADVLYLTAGSRLWLRDTDTGARSRLVAVAEAEYQDNRIGVTTDSAPQLFSWFGDQLHILPAADKTAYEIYGRYVRDITLPTASYTVATNAWTFEADTHTSSWFVEGEGLELIVWLAAREVAITHYNDREVADSVHRFGLEQQARDRIETERRRSTAIPTAYIASEGRVYGDDFQAPLYPDWGPWEPFGP